MEPGSTAASACVSRAPWIICRDVEGVDGLVRQERFICVSVETRGRGDEFSGAVLTRGKVTCVLSSRTSRADATAGGRRRFPDRPRCSAAQRLRLGGRTSRRVWERGCGKAEPVQTALGRPPGCLWRGWERALRPGPMRSALGVSPAARVRCHARGASI